MPRDLPVVAASWRFRKLRAPSSTTEPLIDEGVTPATSDDVSWTPLSVAALLVSFGGGSMPIPRFARLTATSAAPPPTNLDPADPTEVQPGDVITVGPSEVQVRIEGP